MLYLHFQTLSVEILNSVTVLTFLQHAEFRKTTYLVCNSCVKLNAVYITCSIYIYIYTHTHTHTHIYTHTHTHTHIHIYIYISYFIVYEYILFPTSCTNLIINVKHTCFGHLPWPSSCSTYCTKVIYS